MKNEDQDIILVEESQAGDQEAFGMLVQRYQSGLFLLARQLISSTEEAEDVISEAFMRAWKDIRNFRREANFKTWLWRIMINVCRSHLRRRYLQRKVFFWKHSREDEEDSQDQEAQWQDPSAGGDPQKYCELKSLQSMITKARTILSPREQEVFALKYDHEMKIADIGKLLSLSENTVKVLLFRAAKKMAKTLKDYQNGT